MTAPQDTQSRIATATIQAAAIIAAVKAGQDVTAVVEKAVTATAQTAQTAIDAATAIIVRLWRRTDPYDPRSVDRFVAQAGRTIVATQRAVGASAVAGQLTQLRALGIGTKVTVKIPDNVRGTPVLGAAKVVVRTKSAAVDYHPQQSVSPVRVVVHGQDAAPVEVFNRAVVTYRYRRAEGDNHDAANSAAEERIASIVDGNVTLAQRLGEQQTIAQVHAIDERVTGWRRVIHPELSKGGVCGLCVAASDRVYAVKELKPIHARCKCGVSPVTATQDPGHRLNVGDLSRLYDDAGKSTSGAALKRTRYDVVHHHELGPVLVRVKGEKLPYYSTTPAAA